MQLRRAYLVRPNPGGGGDRIGVLLRSRGGRWVEKWEDIRRLENFRVKALPPEHSLYGDARIWDYTGTMADFETELMADWLNEARAREVAR